MVRDSREMPEGEDGGTKKLLVCRLHKLSQSKSSTSFETASFLVLFTLLLCSLAEQITFSSSPAKAS